MSYNKDYFYSIDISLIALRLGEINESHREKQDIFYHQGTSYHSYYSHVYTRNNRSSKPLLIYKLQRERVFVDYLSVCL